MSGDALPGRLVFRSVDALFERIAAAPRPWPGKRRMGLCATVSRFNARTGRQARKAAFAASARRCRRWLAEYKKTCLACGAYYLPERGERS